MKIEVIDNQRILVPDKGMWFYNEQAQVISDKVYLGIEADEEDWVEISTEEKARLEALWNEENSVDPDEASKEDLYNALAELGVS
jgi:hypothetical protein